MTTQTAGEGNQPGRHPSPPPDLTPEEWRYISILIATDIRSERATGFSDILVEKHMPIWEKIQPACRWDEEEDE